MTVKELSEKTGYEVLAGKKGENREVAGIYCGDLLSWVMGKAYKGDVWITVIGNINSAAVAHLTEVSAIILSEDAPADRALLNRADFEGIPVLKTSDSSAAAVVKLNSLLKNE